MSDAWSDVTIKTQRRETLYSEADGVLAGLARSYTAGSTCAGLTHVGACGLTCSHRFKAAAGNLRIEALPTMMSTVFRSRIHTLSCVYGTPCLAQMALSSGAALW